MSLFSNKDLKQLREIQKRLDSMDGQLGDIKKLLTPMRYIPAELEKAIRQTGKRADFIDKQVEDAE